MVLTVGWQSTAYCTCFENRSGLKTTGGSNPSPTATFFKKALDNIPAVW